MRVDPTGMLDTLPQALGPTATISASRTGIYDQTPERYGFNGTLEQWQSQNGCEGCSYENTQGFWSAGDNGAFDASVAAQDKAEAGRIAVEKMGMFAQYYSMIGTVVAPSGGVGNGGVSGVGLRTSSFNFSSPVAESNISVFRVYGGGSNASGFSWTPINPNSVSNFRNAAGLPNVNTGRFAIEGLTRRSSIIKSRSALPLDGNRGGLQEFIINPRNVRIKRVSGVNPEF